MHSLRRGFYPRSSQTNAECMKIDVVMTATLRPEVIDLTLFSFSKNFFAQLDDLRLIINIDPIGESQCQSKDIVEICRRYFGNVIYRSPDQPSFSRAVKWCWEQVEAGLFLHLEDDWLLTKFVPLERVLSRFEQDKDLASLRFNRAANST